jgi:hypothetical protein
MPEQPKSLQERMAELLEDPTVRRKLWTVVTDGEASDQKEVREKAARLRQRMQDLGLQPPDDGSE